MPKTRDKAKVRELIDQLRKTFLGGRLKMTLGVQHLPAQVQTRRIAALRAFDSFNSGNDPHCEHDFGAIDGDGEKFFFKIDYYDLAMSQQTVDPADPEATIRVLTLMCADEY